mmetsp:Transcript_18592/g.46120  ORF Transcript_18592/g.46120 Transcript_18592/m.46120 type:complete len:227 (+) Transcript_18592:87-767(+)
MNDSVISNASEENTVSAMSTATPTATPAAPSAAMAETTPQSPMLKRDDLNGGWILDKSRGEWSMRGYLETLNVPELAIQANEKGENELDTVHVIELSEDKVKITKRSRVNNNLVLELVFGNELVEYLKPDQRPKKQLATTEDPGQHLKIESSLLTVNGMAHVVDIKRLVQEDKGSVLVQELTITNPESQKSHTTTRYFNPKDEPPAGGGELGAAMATAEAAPMETD